MKHLSSWMRTGVAVLLTVGMFGVPQIASARDRCDKGKNNRSSYNYRDNRGGRDYRSTAYRAYPGNSYRANGYRDNRNDSRYYDNRNYRQGRSAGDSAAIIGGSAAVGAVVGGLLGNGKGALYGAGIGGVGGLVYDRATNDRGRRR